MDEQEGVIKYHLNHDNQALDCDTEIIAELNVWRSMMLKLDLIGQNPLRYGGLGFGNISHRCGEGDQFLISGTQTGHLAKLSSDDYSQVLATDLERNAIESRGRRQPSSEALTHATIYQNRSDCHAVIHIHNPDIWRCSQALAIPETAADVAYGTPDMAKAVIALLQLHAFDQGNVFTMAGHEDGVVAFASNLEQAGLSLIKTLSQALLLSD